MILWDVLFRSQQGVAISFLEDVWTRNLLNVFVAPVRTIEYVAATCLVGVLRVDSHPGDCSPIVGSLAYGFHLTDLGLGLLPFLANLMLFGWFLGMVSTALIMRWGQAAESLAWAVPFFIQPLAAVFYPVSVLPTVASTHRQNPALYADLRRHARRARRTTHSMGGHPARAPSQFGLGRAGSVVFRRKSSSRPQNRPARQSGHAIIQSKPHKRTAMDCPLKLKIFPKISLPISGSAFIRPAPRERK